MSNIRQSWYEAGARERIAALVDPRSFAEFVGPECRETSPHLGIDPLDANRNMLAARSIKDLMLASGGLYRPPSRFRNW